jgi:hypothetical protein
MVAESRPALALWTLLILCLATVSASANTPVIETLYDTVGGQSELVGYPDGTFLIVASRPRIVDGELTGDGEIVARRFDAEGRPISDLIDIAITASFISFSGERRLAAARRPDGSFLVAWIDAESYYINGAINVRAFEVDGLPIFPKIEVRSDTGERARSPDVAVRSDGRFLVAWEREVETSPSDIDVFARLYDPDGNALGAEFRVNTFTSDLQNDPQVAATTAGDFAIVWADRTQDVTSYSVFGRLFDGDGNSLTGDFPVHDPESGSQIPGNVVPLNSGGFFVAWESENDGVHARRFDALGQPLGDAFQVSGSGRRPHASTRGDGAVLVAWSDPIPYDSYAGMAGKLYDPAGAPVGDEFVVRRAFPGQADHVRGFLSDSGDAFHVVTWLDGVKGCIGSGPDSDGDGIADSCDPCENPPGQEFGKVSSRFRFIGDTNVRNDHYTLTGRFPLPLSSFSDLDPLTSPVRIRIYSSERWLLLDITLPPTAFSADGISGWIPSASGTRWKYRSKSPEPESGIVRVLLASSSDGLVRIKVAGKNSNYGVPRQDVEPESHQTILVNLGDAGAGDCAEASFVASDCGYDGLGRAFTCRR